MKITLTKAITAHDKEISELELREPTSKDVQELGMPYVILAGGDDQAIQIQVKTICKYAVRLAAIPPSSVDQLSASDINGLVGVVMGFFGVEATE
jgi:hypothetical protein